MQLRSGIAVDVALIPTVTWEPLYAMDATFKKKQKKNKTKKQNKKPTLNIVNLGIE